MSVWEDVVATGLIGTDRRPPPDTVPASWGLEPDAALDPAHLMLTLAARRRAVARAGNLLPSCPPGAIAPASRTPVASPAAHEILARLLSPPQMDLLNLWLRAAAAHRVCASSSYWTPLAIVAARKSELDRSALAKAIGGRGVWFIEQNPQWARLAKVLRGRDEVSRRPEGSDGDVTENAVRADPELIMRAPTPWSIELSRTVLEIVGSGQLQNHGVRYAAAVGARLPLEHYELVQSTVGQIATRDEPLTPAGLRSVREALLALERTVWLRLEMRSAFTGEPIMVERLEILLW
jgi:hypothetical protein